MISTKEAHNISKPTSVYITINHKDDKMIIGSLFIFKALKFLLLGDCIYKYFVGKDSQRPIVNFYYDQKIGKASIISTNIDILPQGTTYTYAALEVVLAHALSCPCLELSFMKNCLFEKHKNFINIAATGVIIDKNVVLSNLFIQE